MFPLSSTANSISSPSLTFSARLISSGSVSCAFGRSLARALVLGRTSPLACDSFKCPPGSALLEAQYLHLVHSGFPTYVLAREGPGEITWRGAACPDGVVLLLCGSRDINQKSPKPDSATSPSGQTPSPPPIPRLSAPGQPRPNSRPISCILNCRKSDSGQRPGLVKRPIGMSG
jgi:hypothetical protein